MQVLQSIKELKAFRESLGVQSVGLVPTMGALHKGHLSLISESSRHNAHTIVSIFVNPTQFGQNEDLSTYPRTLEQDLALCENLGVSAVFAPSVEEMYASDDEIAILPPKMMGYVLEGFDRPTHFAGVLQVVLKLFMLTRPHKAYFGKKDAQQVLIQLLIKLLCSAQCIGVWRIGSLSRHAIRCLRQRGIHMIGKHKPHAGNMQGIHVVEPVRLIRFRPVKHPSGKPCCSPAPHSTEARQVLLGYCPRQLDAFLVAQPCIPPARNDTF